MMAQGQSKLTDEICELTNRIHEAKLSGALTKDEFSKLVICFGELFANKIKQGSVQREEIESVESYLSTFVGENSDKYFNFPHEDLEKCAKTALEKIAVAKRFVEQRKLYDNSSLEQENSMNMVRKLGH